MVLYNIENVRVFDGETLNPKPCSVCISDGLIAHTGEQPTDEAIESAVRISGEGCVLLPGLIDAHTHVFRALDGLKQCIPMGVTTVLDMHNKPDDVKYMKEQCQKSSQLPDILSAYYAATIQDGWPRAIVERHAPSTEVLKSLNDWPTLSTPESIDDYMTKHKALGGDFVKLMQESGECLNFGPLNAPTLGLQTKIIKSAHEYGWITVAHATSLRDTMLVLEAQVDGLAHQFYDKPHTKELVNAYKKHNAFVIPTFTAINSMVGINVGEEFAKDPRAVKSLTDSSLSCLCDRMNIALPHCNMQYAYDCIRELKAQGIDVVCGTDSANGIQGTALGASVHHELALYVQHCAFSPIEALRTATSVAARRFRLEDRGVIAIGKRADLLLVKGDPTLNIGDTLNIQGVWKQGIYVRSD